MNLCNSSAGSKFADFNEHSLPFVSLNDLQVHPLNLYVIVAPFTVSGRCNKKQIYNTDLLTPTDRSTYWIIDF